MIVKMIIKFTARSFTFCGEYFTILLPLLFSTYFVVWVSIDTTNYSRAILV